MPKWLIDFLVVTVLTVFLTVSFMLITDAPAWAGSMLFFILYQTILVRADIADLKSNR